MKNKAFFFAFFLLSIMARGQTISQSLLSSSGGHYENSSYIIDISLGELSVETFSVGSYILTQGFWQTNGITTSINNIYSEFETEIDICPNPSKNSVTIKVHPYKGENIYMEIYDLTGKILFCNEIENGYETINLNTFSDGIYIVSLKINSDIIKNKKLVVKK